MKLTNFPTSEFVTIAIRIKTDGAGTVTIDAASMEIQG
jgi:hypothetical protein